ncbi:MAG: L-aspartate oxidase, partial [Cyanobacteriota bacterium]
MFEKFPEASINKFEKNIYSTVVVGSGISGLYTALKIAEKGIKIALITKDKTGESNTRYAQGGVAAVIPENTCDSIDLHVKDTLSAGAGLSNPDVTRFISENGAKAIESLINYGVSFDKTEDNKLALTIEGAHSVRRVLHSGGDATGKNIEKKLVSLIKEIDNVDIYEEHQAVELLLDQDQICKGVIVFDIHNNKHKLFFSQTTVLATGGLSQVYLNTTNPKVATGDGIALAYRAGGIIQDMEFIQFHPTAFHAEASTRFLISEAVRGEGAKLRNISKELFAHKYDDRADLAPRDIVSRAIFDEMKNTNSDFVYLDATQISVDKLQKRFPNIIEECKKNGIDISKDFIPVSPAAHYSMGGIKSNVYGQTTIKNLYTVGEAACTSLHGANRLASNSLLECVVLAEQVSKDISLKIEALQHDLNLVELFTDPEIAKLLKQYFCNNELHSEINTEELIIKIKNLMWNYASISRSKKGLTHCLKSILEIENAYN